MYVYVSLLQSPQARMPPSPPPKSPHPTTAGSGLQLLHRSQVPAVYKEPFIITGYRKPDCTYADCLKYIFVLHNDVGNFWTHFLPLWVWLAWLYWLSLQVDLTDPYYYPLLCFWMGACTYAVFSSMAHLVGCKSFTVRSIAFMTDYLGIAMYSFGGGLLSVFYQPPSGSFWFRHKETVIVINVVFGINATVMSAMSRFFCVKQRYIIRTLAFSLSYFVVVTPFVHRMQVCFMEGKDCIPETLHLHALGFVLTFTLAFFFVTKIPERFAPGRFDVIGQSHQLFHLAAAALTSVQMHMFPIEAEIRKEDLMKFPGFRPDFSSTFLPYIFVQVFGILTVSVFSVLVTKRVLISNKKDVVQDLLSREAHKTM